MSRDTLLARGRGRLAEALVDTCLIQRVVGETTNLVSGKVDKTYQTVYSGACRVQQAAAPWAGPAAVGQAAIRLSALELQLPVKGAQGLLVDDQVTITAARNDPELVGRVFSIVGAHHASEKPTRRLPLQEVLS